jgi:hypothetical protein
MAPPDRPNDRSMLSPSREEWGNVGGAYLPEKRKRVEEWGILPPKG